MDLNRLVRVRKLFETIEGYNKLETILLSGDGGDPVTHRGIGEGNDHDKICQTYTQAF
jgi:hypothetical protein